MNVLAGHGVDERRSKGTLRNGEALAKRSLVLGKRTDEHFLDDVNRTFGARIDAQMPIDGLQAVEEADRGFGAL